MSKANEQFQQVSDLVVEAFDTFNAAAGETYLAGSIERDRAALQVHAADVLATLALTQEVRALGLLLAASVTPADGSPVNPNLVEEAFTAAVTHLDLVEPEPVESPMAEFLAGWDKDPADQDVDK